MNLLAGQPLRRKHAHARRAVAHFIVLTRILAAALSNWIALRIVAPSLVTFMSPEEPDWRILFMPLGPRVDLTRSPCASAPTNEEPRVFGAFFGCLCEKRDGWVGVVGKAEKRTCSFNICMEVVLRLPRALPPPPDAFAPPTSSLQEALSPMD